MDGISVMIGIIAGAIFGGCIMREQGYTRGRLDEMEGKDRLNSLYNELQEIKESIEELKVEQEVLDTVIRDIKSDC